MAGFSRRAMLSHLGLSDSSQQNWAVPPARGKHSRTQQKRVANQRQKGEMEFSMLAESNYTLHDAGHNTMPAKALDGLCNLPYTTSPALLARLVLLAWISARSSVDVAASFRAGSEREPLKDGEPARASKRSPLPFHAGGGRGLCDNFSCSQPTQQIFIKAGTQRKAFGGFGPGHDIPPGH